MRSRICMAVLLGMSMFAAAEDFNNVVVVDKMCADKAKANPDAHTRSCAMGCKDSGFGIVTADGKFIKFDKAGDEKFMSVLKDTKKNDHLRANVSGKVEGNTIKVASVKLL
ncbi:MAG: hypothetical protein NVS9B15_13590 [Acidobacteriaceae bacterium]